MHLTYQVLLDLEFTYLVKKFGEISEKINKGLTISVYNECL